MIFRLISIFSLVFLISFSKLSNAEYLYVSFGGSNSIGQYQKDGTTVTYPIVNVPSPRGVAVDANGNIYVVSQSTTIIKYNSSGAVINSSLISGLNGGYFITISSDGFLYVAEQGAGTVKKYNLDGTQVNTFSLTGLQYPSGIVTDTSGNLYVADYIGGFVGKYSAATGTVITAPFITVLAFTIAVDPSGNIYTGNLNDGIRKYNSSGTLISATFATGNSDSYSLVADSDGNIYNGNSNGDVNKYNSSGTLISNSLVSPFGNGTILGLALGTPPSPAAAAAPIPTLSEWSLIALAFMVSSLLFLHKKREVA